LNNKKTCIRCTIAHTYIAHIYNSTASQNHGKRRLPIITETEVRVLVVLAAALVAVDLGAPEDVCQDAVYFEQVSAGGKEFVKNEREKRRGEEYLQWGFDLDTGCSGGRGGTWYMVFFEEGGGCEKRRRRREDLREPGVDEEAEDDGVAFVVVGGLVCWIGEC
jgi:hypothetical protein